MKAIEKTLYVLQAFKIKQNIPRPFDLYAPVFELEGDNIQTDDGYTYQVISKNTQSIDLVIEKKRDPNDFPLIINTQTKEETSIQEKLHPDEILAEKGRCSIFKDGIIIVEHNHYAGGSKGPVKFLLESIEKKAGQKGAKISYMYDQASFEEYIRAIQEGELSLDVIKSSTLLGTYELGEQNVPKQTLNITFKHGDSIASKIWNMVTDGVAKVKFVKDKKSKDRMKDSKGIHATKVGKTVSVKDNSEVFAEMHQYKNELEINKYLIISGAELISLEK